MKTNKGTDLEAAIHGGIYAIMVDKRPIYIGYTMRPFLERFQEHKERIAGLAYPNISLYGNMTEYEKKNYYFSILFDVEKVKYKRKINGPFNRRELKCIECAFIYSLKPKYNIDGLIKPYSFL